MSVVHHPLAYIALARRLLAGSELSGSSGQTGGTEQAFVGPWRFRPRHTAAKPKPDVILLDIGLPRINGFEAGRQIRQQQGDGEVVLVALTGWART